MASSLRNTHKERIAITVFCSTAAFHQASLMGFDVVALDLQWRPTDATSVIRGLRKRLPDTPIIAFNSCDSSEERVSILEAGGDDCVPGILSIRELRLRLAKLRRYSAPFESRESITGRLLTPAEARVAMSIGEGRSVPEIAAMLATSVHTVRSQLKRIFQKTGTKRQSDLVRWVLTEGTKLCPAELAAHRQKEI